MKRNETNRYYGHEVYFLFAVELVRPILYYPR